MNPDIDRWFAQAILPHEGALTGYLSRVWRNPADIPDLRQDIYVKIYESAARERPEHAKAFLFATARNMLADRLRRTRVVSIDYTQDLESLNVLVDEISPEQRLSARQDLRRLANALDALPDACRNVIWLKRVEGLSQQEIARRLGMKEGTLESHLSRGVRMLAKMFFGGTRPNARKEREISTRKEAEDGQG